MSKVAPYELPQVVAQIPPPPIDILMHIQKALLVEGENKVVSHLIHGESELTNASWSKLQKNAMFVETKSTSPSREKEDPEVSNIDKRNK